MFSASSDVAAVVKEAMADSNVRRPLVAPIIAAMRALEDTQDPAVRHLITSVMPPVEKAAQAELAARAQELERSLSLYPSDRELLVETYIIARSAQILGTRPADPSKLGLKYPSPSEPSSSPAHRPKRTKKVVCFIRFFLLSQNKAGKHNTDRVFRPIVEKLLRMALTAEDKEMIDLDEEEWGLLEELIVGSAITAPHKLRDDTIEQLTWQSALVSLKGAPVAVFFGRDCPVDDKDAKCTCDGGEDVYARRKRLTADCALPPLDFIVSHMDLGTIIIIARRNDRGVWRWERTVRERLLADLCDGALDGHNSSSPARQSSRITRSQAVRESYKHVPAVDFEALHVTPLSPAPPTWARAGQAARQFHQRTDDEAVVIVAGSVNASKQRDLGSGDAGAPAFRYASRPSSKAADDVAKTLLLIGLMRQTFDPELERALLDPTHGETLLAGFKYKESVAVPAAKRSPLLVEWVQSLRIKHPEDATTPATSALHLRPLRNPPKDWLSQAGFAAGLELAIGTSHYRRSFAISERLEGKKTPDEIAKAMQHQPSEVRLHQDVYTAEKDPELHAEQFDFYTGEQSESTRSALTSLHAVPKQTRPLRRRRQDSQRPDCKIRSAREGTPVARR